MRLYAGSVSDFLELDFNNQLADLLREAFFKQNGFSPSPGEVMSWRNSLGRLARVFERAELKEHGVFVEYQLPMTSKRIDVIVCGRNVEGNKQALLIELKQWEACTLTDYDSERVVTWVGHGHRAVLHPSVQVGNYKYYLQDNHTAFYEGSQPIQLAACSYLHNYPFNATDPLFDVRFRQAIERFPVFTSDHAPDLTEHIKRHVAHGEGLEVLTEIEQSRHRPSRKLLLQASTAIREKLKGPLLVFGNVREKGDYILLDEQLVVYDTVFSLVRKGLADRQKFAIIVKGGAGTGKSVIALQLLADLTAVGRNAQYATGSRSFTQTLRKIIGREYVSLFKYFMSYGEAEPNEIDVLIMDEAHRIRERTGYPHRSTGRLQVEDLIRAAKVSIFFIDDFQVVRKGEIGSSAFIREKAEEMGCKVFEYELEAQFRCGGSEGFTNWVDNTLQIRRTANALWQQDENFEFRIFESPESLEAAIREKNDAGYTARVMAGFCWPWADKPQPDGTLVNDVKIENYERPWNARDGMTGLRKGIPASQYWAYDAGGIDQIGCVYTAQGFEFDYAGIIIGRDLVYSPEENAWIGNKEASFDTQVKGSKNFLQLVKNTYRVLLTRGIKGCYVYFMDKETEKFVRSRIEYGLK